MNPVLRVEPSRVAEDETHGTCKHPQGGVLFIQRVQRDQLPRTLFDGLPVKWPAAGLKIALKARLALLRIIVYPLAQGSRQHRQCIQQWPLLPALHTVVVALQEQGFAQVL